MLPNTAGQHLLADERLASAASDGFRSEIDCPNYFFSHTVPINIYKWQESKADLLLNKLEKH